MCERAIEGIAHDPFTATRRNGTTRKFDGWEQAFGDRGKFEEACNKAPLNFDGTLATDAEEVAARS